MSGIEYRVELEIVALDRSEDAKTPSFQGRIPERREQHRTALDICLLKSLTEYQSVHVYRKVTTAGERIT